MNLPCLPGTLIFQNRIPFLSLIKMTFLGTSTRRICIIK
uniref:Maturase K n=1 Tax=Mammillaria longiflora TaxID=867427 RepID=H1ZTB3_9CARY|nr:maturase K [Mammillaria longiflora]